MENNSNGASYPPCNPTPSWYVPRVSLPGIMGMQPYYLAEWWYYAGIIQTESGQSFSIMFTIQRYGIGKFQVGAGMLGIGWKNEDISHSLHGMTYGIGASQTTDEPSLLNALSITPVTDTDFELKFKPLIEMVGTNGEFPYNLNASGTWNVKYTGGENLASEGSMYSLFVEGKGYITTSNDSSIRDANYRLSIDLLDHKGMVMENNSGIVGNSYECAQPLLEVIFNGSLTIDGNTLRIAKGLLWMDRQMLSGAVDGEAVPLSEEKHLLSWLAKNRKLLGKTLYTGNWMSLTLENGLSLALAEFWKSHQKQWISGTRIGNKNSNPQKGGFGNIYYNKGYIQKAGNGGRFLRPRLDFEQPDSEWDYDINLLEPQNEGVNSPHWISPQSGITYATAWHIEFSPELQIDGLDKEMFVFVMCDNSEILIDDHNSFFEGAAHVYDNSGTGRKIIGQAFVEQMGYN